MDAEFFAFQRDLEQTWSDNQIFPRIRRDFRERGITEAKLAELGIEPRFGMDLLVQMALHKRASLPTLVGLLRRHFTQEQNPSQACADALLEAAKQDLMNWVSSLDLFVVIWDVSAQCAADLERYQYPLPMVIPPRPLKTNTDTGYLTVTESVILKDNHTEDDVCLDHLNRVNQIPLRINADVARMVKNRWKNLDRPKDGEHVQDYQKRKSAFEKYDRNSKEVMELLDVGNDGVFYMTHKYDKRGRTYAQGYHVNPQGSPWNKACIEFVNQEVALG
jgi:hypothetical protein